MELVAFFEFHPAFLAVILGLFGLLVGSFLNVIIYRLPLILEQQAQWEFASSLNHSAAFEQELSLWKPNSFCPQCKKTLSIWMNIPIVSYVTLKGRSRCCQQVIALRYLLVELFSCLAALSLTLFFPLSLKLLAGLIFIWILIPLLVIDLEKQYLPDQLTMPLLWFGLLINILETFTKLTTAVLGAVFGYLFCYLLAWLFKQIRHKEGMGYGDFKLVAALGAWFGWQLLPAILFVASCIGAIFSLTIILLKKARYDLPIPFGPFLAIAGIVILIWGTEINLA